MIPTEPIATSAEVPTKPRHSDYAALDLLILLVRRRRFLLRFTLGAAVLAVIVALLLPNEYTATAVVLPPVDHSLSSAMISQLGSPLLTAYAGSLGMLNASRTYTALVHSETIENAMIRRFDLKARYHKKTLYDARLALEKHSSALLGNKDGLIRISIRDRDPKQAAEMANTFVDELRKLSSTLAVTEAAQRRLFFQQQLKDAKEKLAASEEALKETEQKSGMVQIDSQARALIEAAATLRAQVVAKQVQIQAMRAYATEDNPELMLAKQQLAALQAQLAKLGGTGQDPDSGLLVLKGRVPEAGMEYVRKLRDVKYHETIMGLLARQFEAAQLDEAREGATIQVANPAIPPDRKSSPHRAVIVLVATMLGLMIAIGWCIAAEAVNRMHEDPGADLRLAQLRAAMRDRRRPAKP